METILIATDFSKAAMNATEYGANLAKYFNARLVLAHAYPVPPADYKTRLAVEMKHSLREAADELEKTERRVQG